MKLIIYGMNTITIITCAKLIYDNMITILIIIEWIYFIWVAYTRNPNEIKFTQFFGETSLWFQIMEDSANCTICYYRPPGGCLWKYQQRTSRKSEDTLTKRGLSTLQVLFHFTDSYFVDFTFICTMAAVIAFIVELLQVGITFLCE